MTEDPLGAAPSSRRDLERIRPEREAPGAAVLDERDTHVVCDALAEVRVRHLRQPEAPLARVAAQVYEQHVEGYVTYREQQTLEGAGEEQLAREGLPATLSERYAVDRTATLALLGFVSLVAETYGYSADAWAAGSSPAGTRSGGIRPTAA